MPAEVHGTRSWGYCRQEKSMFKAKSIEYQKSIVGEDISAEALSGKIGKPPHTLPRIFLDGEYIGGYTELAGRLGISSRSR